MSAGPFLPTWHRTAAWTGGWCGHGRAWRPLQERACNMKRVACARRQVGSSMHTSCVGIAEDEPSCAGADAMVSAIASYGWASSGKPLQSQGYWCSPAGSSLLMSSLRVRPRVSCASRMVLNRPARPFISRCCTGARLQQEVKQHESGYGAHESHSTAS